MAEIHPGFCCYKALLSRSDPTALPGAILIVICVPLFGVPKIGLHLFTLGGFLCTGAQKSTLLKCSLVVLHGGLGAWRLNL